jgi:hypothetical protein
VTPRYYLLCDCTPTIMCDECQRISKADEVRRRADAYVAEVCRTVEEDMKGEP